ncbi:MAG: Asp-tRNA(Asn)/Glu-tRNA(Gln) amidotransferase subunit GatC [Firmicutes bacterium]|nr:Asp-tRNA(Asn)/Glu-tRNA(Gln) amidotransferase subunit GatC [Bacillota bacterium]
MKKFTQEMVVSYADKLLIGLKEDEVEMVLSEFEAIDKEIDLINEIPNIESVEPMTHCLDDFEYVLREDIVEESVDIDELLQNCDSKLDREVKVPKVVE